MTRTSFYTVAALCLAGCGDSGTSAPDDARVTPDAGSTADAPSPVLDAGAGDVGDVDVGVDVVAVEDVVTPVDDGPPVARDYVATLEGSQAVPAVHDSTATGRFTLRVEADRARAHWTLTHSVTDATGAALRFGWPGEVGTPALELPTETSGAEGDLDLTPALADAIEAGRLAVELRTAHRVGGELRGQVVRPGEEVYVSALSGDQGTSTVATSPARGGAAFFIDRTTRRARYAVRLIDVEPTTVDLHDGPAFGRGPSLVTLAARGANASGELSLPEAALAALDRGRLYIDAHSAGYPEGATRGQVLRPGEELYAARLTGQSFPQPRATWGSGYASVIVSADRRALLADGGWIDVTPLRAALVDAPDDLEGTQWSPLTVSDGRVSLPEPRPSARRPCSSCSRRAACT
ncbi:MAG: CHRD domain-containing protein [Polyangiales bacterium]